MSYFFRIILFVTLSSFAFSSTAAAMLCDIDNMDNTEMNESMDKNHSDSCHDDDSDNSVDESMGDCCHDMNLCHASSSLLDNSALNRIDITHFSIQKQENDNLIMNSSFPPDRPPKHLA